MTNGYTGSDISSIVQQGKLISIREFRKAKNFKTIQIDVWNEKNQKIEITSCLIPCLNSFLINILNLRFN